MVHLGLFGRRQAGSIRCTAGTRALGSASWEFALLYCSVPFLAPLGLWNRRWFPLFNVSLASSPQVLVVVQTNGSLAVASSTI